MAIKVVVFDDNFEVKKSWGRMFRIVGQHEVIEVGSEEEFLRVSSQPLDIDVAFIHLGFFVETNIGDITPESIVKVLPPEARRILMSGGVDIQECKKKAVELGGDHFIHLPVGTKALLGYAEMGKVAEEEKEVRVCLIRSEGKIFLPQTESLPVRGFEEHDFGDSYYRKPKEV